MTSVEPSSSALSTHYFYFKNPICPHSSTDKDPSQIEDSEVIKEVETQTNLKLIPAVQKESNTVFTTCQECTFEYLKEITVEQFITIAQHIKALSLYCYSHGMIIDSRLRNLKDIPQTARLPNLAINIYILTLYADKKRLCESILNHIEVAIKNKSKYSNAELTSIAIVLDTLGFFNGKEFVQHPLHQQFRNILTVQYISSFNLHELCLLVFALRNVDYNANFSLRTITSSMYKRLLLNLHELQPVHLSMIAISAVQSGSATFNPILDEVKKYLSAKPYIIELFSPDEALRLMKAYFSQIERIQSKSPLDVNFYRNLIFKNALLISKFEISEKVRTISELAQLNIVYRDFLEDVLKEAFQSEDVLSNEELGLLFQYTCDLLTVREELLSSFIEKINNSKNTMFVDLSAERQIHLTRALTTRLIQQSTQNKKVFKELINTLLKALSSNNSLFLSEETLNELTYTLFVLSSEFEIATDILTSLNNLIETARKSLKPLAEKFSFESFRKNVIKTLQEYLNSKNIEHQLCLNQVHFGIKTPVSIPELKLYICLENECLFDEKGRRFFIDILKDHVARINGVHLLRICTDEWPGYGDYTQKFDQLRLEHLEHKLSKIFLTENNNA